MSLGVAFGWHVHDLPTLQDLVLRAEALGYGAAFVDGDAALVPSRRGRGVLESWTVTTALLARTERIVVGSLRLVHHWHAARLAQAVATAEHLAPGRLDFFVSVGGVGSDQRFGLPTPPVGARIRWLDETLTVVRRLWAGEEVTFEGEFVRLDGAWVGPPPRGGRMPIAVAARGPRLLRVVARHADRWDVNLPPVRHRVAAAAAALEAHCRALGRDPGEISRSLWIFTRPGRDPADPELRAEFRRLNPWFADVPDDELGEALVAGPPAACRERLEAIRRGLGVTLPVVDLSGLDAAHAREALEALAPA